MFHLDTSTPFGQRVQQHLQQNTVVWLTTVGQDGTPQPSVVWFYWDGETLEIHSERKKPKLRHIQRNGRVALNFDSNGQGGDVVVITGDARILDGEGADVSDGFAAKYSQGFQRLGVSRTDFGAKYGISITITPDALRGH